MIRAGELEAVTAGQVMAARAAAVADWLTQRDAELEAQFQDYQQWPPGDWWHWGHVAGRNTGKTWNLSTRAIQHLRRYGPDARVTVLARTRDDVKGTNLHGLTGIFTLYGDEFIEYNRADLVLIHEYGGRLECRGGIIESALRGPQSSLLLVDEYATVNPASIEMAILGNRVGPDARAIFFTTPKPTAQMRALFKDAQDPESGVIIWPQRPAAMRDNVHADARLVARFEYKHRGTRLGRQELFGEMLSDVEGALWTWDMISAMRCEPPSRDSLSQVIVGVDPAASSKSSSAETGIVACGRHVGGTGMVLESNGVRGEPHVWAREAIAMYDRWSAEAILVEKNQGGEMCRSTILSQRKGIRVRDITASKSKYQRAAPVSGLCEHRPPRIMLAGTHDDLENQMTSMCPAFDPKAAWDRLDAMVHGIRYLFAQEIGLEPEELPIFLARLGGGNDERGQCWKRQQ